MTYLALFFLSLAIGGMIATAVMDERGDAPPIVASAAVVAIFGGWVGFVVCGLVALAMWVV